jgi:hypothetical protein
MKTILSPPRLVRGENFRPPRRVSWEIKLASYLLVLSRVQQDRIERLEELNGQLARALDEQRQSAGRRAAA